MNKSERPVIVPTALSAAVLLWGLVLLAAFGAALFAYAAWSRLDAARARLATPAETTVATDFFNLKMPAACCRYAQETNRAVLSFHETETTPFLSVAASRDPAFAYRALDLNPALFARRIESVLREEGALAPDAVPPDVVSTARAHLRQGVPIAQAFFSLDAREGLAFSFYLGDIRYFAVAAWHTEMSSRDAAVRAAALALPQTLGLPAAIERFSRPVVNSAQLDAAEHARIDVEEARERALWKLYAQRVAVEPETALCPAIEHFRRLLTLAASVQEERGILASEDFTAYEGFLRLRARVVNDWFVQLDKHQAVGDLNAAHKQAQYILRHATLEDEALMRRRAAHAETAIAARRAAAQDSKRKGE